jgi:hypothetical protein
VQLVSRKQSLSDENKSDTALSESSSKCAKRRNQIEMENPAKRFRLGLQVHENNEQEMEAVSSKFLSQDSDGHIDLVNPQNEATNGAVEEILVSDVGISDFFALSKNKGLLSIFHSLLAFIVEV